MASNTEPINHVPGMGAASPRRRGGTLGAATLAATLVALVVLGAPTATETAYRADGIGGTECNPWGLSHSCSSNGDVAPKPDPNYGRHHQH